MVIGHAKVLAYFDKAIKNKSLAHSYALIGRASLGKMTLARVVAGKILGVAPEKLATHPDFTAVFRLTDEKTGKLKTEISVAQARELKNSLTRPSWSAEYRVVIIKEADKLSLEAGNALLKFLEEPVTKTVVFLLAEDDGDILPTVKSRVQIFNLFPVATAELSAGLKADGYAAAEIESVLALSFGRPGVALALLNDESERARVVAEHQRFEALRGQPFYSQVKRTEDLFSKTNEEETRQAEKIADLFNWWSLWWQEELVSNLKLPDNNEPRAAQKILGVLDALSEGRRFLAQQVNPRLVLENVIMQF
ncbi:MAG: hypothetical protein Q7K39_00800 [Candidatus Magasanikbacteria bacterium]|nr:hypothetical protein [Candidatus Magasanikbacteria bacterium]